MEENMLKDLSLDYEDIAKRLSEAIENDIRKKAEDLIGDIKKISTSFSLRLLNESKTFSVFELNASQPVEIAQDPKKLSQFTKVRDETFEIPTSLADFPDWAILVNRAQDLIAMNDLTLTQEGQASLLKRIFSSPEYTQAHLKRDLKCLQLCPPKRNQQILELSELIKKSLEASKVESEKCLNNYNFSKKLFLDELSDEYQKLKKDVIRREEILSKAAEDLVRHIKAYSQFGTLPQGLGEKIDMLARARTPIYKLDLLNYMTFWIPTRFEMVDSSDFDRAEAFSVLFKEQNSLLPLKFKSQARAADQKSVVTFDVSRFEVDQKNANDAYLWSRKTEKIYYPRLWMKGSDHSYTIDELISAESDPRNVAHRNEIQMMVMELNSRLYDLHRPDRHLSLEEFNHFI